MPESLFLGLKLELLLKSADVWAMQGPAKRHLPIILAERFIEKIKSAGNFALRQRVGKKDAEVRLQDWRSFKPRLFGFRPSHDISIVHFGSFDADSER
jgi:hypothetical protein